MAKLNDGIAYIAFTHSSVIKILNINNGTFDNISTHFLLNRDFTGAFTAQYLSSIVNVFSDDAAAVLSNGLRLEHIPMICSDMYQNQGSVFTNTLYPFPRGTGELRVSQEFFENIIRSFVLPDQNFDNVTHLNNPRNLVNIITNITHDPIIRNNFILNRINTHSSIAPD